MAIYFVNMSGNEFSFLSVRRNCGAQVFEVGSQKLASISSPSADANCLKAGAPVSIFGSDGDGG